MNSKTAKNYGNPTLGEVSAFIFAMLGSFCEEKGFTKALRNKYIQEPTCEFRKYAFYDGKSEMSRLLTEFRDIVFGTYKARCVENTSLLGFPDFLVSSITRLTHVFSKSKQYYILQVAIQYYFGYIVYKGKLLRAENPADAIQKMTKETYSDIIKEISNVCMELNDRELSEQAKWKTIEEFLKAIKESPAKEKDKSVFSAKIVRHFLSLNFKKALIEVFEINKDSCEDLFKYICENTENLGNFAEDAIKFAPLNEPKIKLDDESESSAWIWYAPAITGLCTDPRAREKFDNMTVTVMSDSVSTYSKVKYSSDSYKCHALATSFPGEPLADFYSKWLKARMLILSLRFDESDSDKESIHEALMLYKEAFDNYKYLAGKNLAQFLVDAISADVYFNRKPLKDIIGNSQDNTVESSILKPGKSYWEFGYAVGLLPESSERTYLAAFNAEKNFWEAFPLPKFENRDAALKRYEEEMADEELNVLNLVAGLPAVKKIGGKRERISRRSYSSLSIAIMKAESEDDYRNIGEYIYEAPVKSLISDDESGASPLVRALQEFKNLTYGFSKEYRKNRARILSEYQKKFDTIEKYVEGQFANSELHNKNLVPYFDEFKKKYISSLISGFAENWNSYAKNSTPELAEDLRQKAKLLKTAVILPLIDKIAASEYADTLLDEAIELDVSHCVSALQLAIDSYDSEIVSSLVKRLPEKKRNLAKIYISDEYTTPLQYAIRKYDLLMQSLDRCTGHEDSQTPLTYREVPRRKTVHGGILQNDRARLGNMEKAKFSPLKLFWFEECGRNFDRIPKNEHKNDSIVFKQQKELRKIIDILAANTNPISVDNFYYLVEQAENTFEPYADVVDITRALIDTGKAELSGTGAEWLPENILPEETLLARCIRLRSYGMMQMFLEDYPEKFKGVINQLVMGTGESSSDFRVETDVHMFVLNQIESTKLWINMPAGKEKDNYGKMTAAILNRFLTLFKKAGADFTIKDQGGRSVMDLLREWKDKFPEGAIPADLRL